MMADKVGETAKHTALPWHWEWGGNSVLALYGPRDEYDHVLWTHVCKACAARNNRCTAPSDEDCEFIVTACNAHYELIADRDRLREVLQGYEQWEASVVHDRSSADVNRLIELHQLRNAVLHPEHARNP